jgi:glycosyltransferase involved in cell wall biosynthesis
VETTTQHRILIAHPSAELYGSDRVALESARACRQAGWAVDVTLTDDGPLVELLEQAGCAVTVQAAPVLRKSYLSPIGLLRFAGRTMRCTPAMIRLLRRSRPDVVYISTVTVPWWLVLARLAGARVICHVHEAEDAVPRVIRIALAAPLLLAHRVIANSEVSRDIVVAAVRRLAGRTDVIYNGVPGPPAVTSAREVLAAPIRLVLVGRVSARKGTDVAVAALAALAERGIEATLDLVGGVFPGYEWFETDVRRQIADAGLTEAVNWSGVQPEVWSALADADIALVPSRVEPFGNAAVEAMLAGRPVIAGDTQGLREIVRPGDNGELAAPGDGAALAAAIERTVTDWPATRKRADAARLEALKRFSPQAYRDRIVTAVSALTGKDR